MEIRGRCGLLLNWACRAEGAMREGRRPGKEVVKKSMSGIDGEEEEVQVERREAEREEGRKSVHVNERS